MNIFKKFFSKGNNDLKPKVEKEERLSETNKSENKYSEILRLYNLKEKYSEHENI